jgi:hypothetical protein
LSVFQVINSDPEEFQNFSPNFVDLIRESSKKKLLLNKQNAKSSMRLRDPQFLSIGDVSQNQYRLDFPATSPLQASICFPERSNSISAETINSVLDTSFNYFQKSLEDIIAQTRDVITGSATNGRGLSAAVQNYLLRVGMDMSNVNLAGVFTGNNYQFFEPAWTSVKVSKLTDPVFKYVIYASEEDLNDMIRQFNGTIIEGSASEVRDKLYGAYEAMVVTYFGSDSKISDELKNKLTLDSVISKITGLPSRTPLLHEIRLEDIRDVNKVTDTQIEEIQRTIQESIDKLNLAKGDAEGTMRDVTDDGIFYWIPQDYLP